MNAYISALFLTTLILNADGTALKPDLPMKVYGINCVMNGKDITYRMDNLKNVGKEVLCKIDYRATVIPGTDVVSEKEVAEKFAGYMGQDWDTLKTDTRYTKHYSVTKSEKLATYDEQGTKTLYKGADKDEVVKFVEFDVIQELDLP